MEYAVPSSIRVLAIAFVCFLLQVAPASAAQQAQVQPARAAAPLPTLDEAVKRVQVGRVQAYEQLLAEYAAAAAAAPSDPAIAVARCRFIWQFTDEDYDWVERAPKDLDACAKQLDARWPKDARVRLFDLDQQYGEDAVKLGGQWLDDAKGWPVDLRRDLFAKLSSAYGNDEIHAGDYAVQAADLGDTDMIPKAVKRLAGAGEAKRAQALLHDAKPATSAWSAAKRIEAALELPDHGAALAELRRYDAANFHIAPVTVAKACLRGGDVACARKALAEAKGTTDELKSLRFDAALAASDMPAAVNAIDIAGGKGIAAAIKRFALVLDKAPMMLFTGKLMLVAFVFLIVLMVMSLLPALLLVPVHYRGLVRRVRGKPTTPLFDGVGLRQAWWAGGVISCVPLLVALVVAPHSMQALLGGQSLPQQDELVWLTLWGSLVGLLLLVPIARRIGPWRIFGDRIAWRSWWRVLLAWGVLIALSFVLNRIHSHADTSTLQTKMVQSLVDGGRASVGLPATLLLIALLVPIYEELVFRGILLGGMSRHISFGWANILQATLFAIVHNDSPRFLLYLALGLLCGWLAKRSRSLGPSIALHGANNALATVIRAVAGG